MRWFLEFSNIFSANRFFHEQASFSHEEKYGFEFFLRGKLARFSTAQKLPISFSTKKSIDWVFLSWKIDEISHSTKLSILFPTKKSKIRVFPFVENWCDFPQHKTIHRFSHGEDIDNEFFFRGK